MHSQLHCVSYSVLVMAGHHHRQSALLLHLYSPHHFTQYLVVHRCRSFKRWVDGILITDSGRPLPLLHKLQLSLKVITHTATHIYAQGHMTLQAVNEATLKVGHSQSQ